MSEHRERPPRGASGTWAILVAAGSGERLGADRPKAFAPLGGRALVAESLERLDLSDWIDAIVVTAPAGWEEALIVLAEELVVSKVAAVVTGGRTRADSVAIALTEVSEAAVAVVVHDAARPLVDDEVIERVLTPLGEGYDGVVPALPLADTVKRVRSGTVVETLPRADLVAVQTPQAFLADVLRRAYAGDLAGATDCASLVEAAGGRVRVVDGSHRLVKVTTRDDLERVETLLAEEGS
ncbi:MAG: 2-C-methyl-D-erythritol 4-phosphate cytidylyltransferase [Actinobacteria bacterium]|nr:2-C-methyl-D-erythritol 4-phosphate cytidylyltransferase [Actinomycetota bacterium]